MSEAGGVSERSEAKTFAYMLFDGPPAEILPWIGAELLLRDRFIANSKSPLARLSLPYRLVAMDTADTRTPFRQRFGIFDLFLGLTHNARREFRLHGLSGVPGFTLAEGFREWQDPNVTYLPVSRACIHAKLRCYWFLAGRGRCTFNVTGPGSGLRRVDHWREEDGSGEEGHENGTPLKAEGAVAGKRLTARRLELILANLHPDLPGVLERRDLSESWSFRNGFRGQNVNAFAEQAALIRPGG